jgi:hypothetical protein
MIAKKLFVSDDNIVKVTDEWKVFSMDQSIHSISYKRVDHIYLHFHEGGRLKAILSTSVTVGYFLLSLDVDMIHSFVRNGMDRLIHRKHFPLISYLHNIVI